MKLYDRQFANTSIDKKINNIKGESLEKRFVDILSDPSNLVIDRCDNAGCLLGDNVVMHNNLLVSKYGYYQDFSKILQLNKGVHEPAEERMFGEVLKYIPNRGTMIELGSYWAFYAMWFFKKIPEANVYCIEPDAKRMKVGIDNCYINGVRADFTQARIGKSPVHKKSEEIDLEQFLKNKNINSLDILHCDIQGNELFLLKRISNILKEKRIKYLFISTHYQNTHYECINTLKENGYRIIASADVDNETFCYDGIIVSCQEENKDIPYTSLGNRKHTPLRNKCLV